MQAVLEFLEGAASEWTTTDLIQWIQQHLVNPGLMKRPMVLREPGAKPLRLDDRAEADSSFEELLLRARGRVLEAVRGLIAPVADDRFLHAAIYGGRVRRAAVDGKAAWVPSPREIDFLGDIALSVLAAAVLTDREYYREHLGLCELCGRVTFRDSADTRPQCAEHRISGFTARVR
ncbi:hypothetical protein [Chondromyces crocatus]|uniref:Uncharacterized protein n=1 Tax=Chondromyces crocatus TaxID=52 RepID=A0A0K1EG72_CHOCO|nr:hypothetical protein [Chondromyces crocatus]AKT39687.1 uncharacterized protein CMC5_038360 [Chondromyces crocatus]